MAVILVLNENGYFSDSRVKRETEALAQANWQVEVLVVPSMKEEIQDGQVARPGIRLYPIQLDKRAGIQGSWAKLARFRSATRGYVARAQTLVYDVIHVNDLDTLPAGVTLKKKTGAGLVYDSHELFPEQLAKSPSWRKEAFRFVYRSYFKWLERRLIKHVDRVITVNESIANELSRRYRIPPPTVVMNCPSLRDRAATFHEGIDPYRFMFPQIGVCKILLYNGGINEGRGLEGMVAAMRWIEGAVLVLMGQGPLEAQLRSIAHQNQVDGRVFFYPPVPPQQVIPFSSWADLGILPYPDVCLNNYYSLPNKLFEYLLAGLPVAGSDLPEIRKVLVENQFGVVFNAKDPEDMALKINTLLSDRSGWKTMKENVLGRAPSFFNWEKEAAKLIDVYTSLYGEVTLSAG